MKESLLKFIIGRPYYRGSNPTILAAQRRVVAWFVVMVTCLISFVFTIYLSVSYIFPALRWT